MFPLPADPPAARCFRCLQILPLPDVDALLVAGDRVCVCVACVAGCWGLVRHGKGSRSNWRPISPTTLPRPCFACRSRLRASGRSLLQSAQRTSRQPRRGSCGAPPPPRAPLAAFDAAAAAGGSKASLASAARQHHMQHHVSPVSLPFACWRRQQ
eukprot:363451-Chlamydomonas_euryale.AAC.1